MTLALAAVPVCALLVLAVVDAEAEASTACASAAVSFEAETAERETADALAAGLDIRGAADAGATWVGKLASVGGGRRDAIIHVPAGLDRTRPVELVVFMDGYGSFAERTMESRHAAAIAAIAASGANAVYVAPDAPSSRFGTPTAAGPYWKAGCAAVTCAGGHAAPGDFAAFHADVVAHVDRVTCATAAERAATEWRLALVGFSNGGRGVRDAIAQLASPRSAVSLADVGLARVVYADAVYGAAWLADAWDAVAELGAAVDVAVVVQAGGVGRADARPGRGNRARAWAFARRLGARRWPGAEAGALEVAAGAVRLRVVQVGLDHPAIGDAAAAGAAAL